MSEPPHSDELPRGTASEVFVAFLSLGLTSFGGPVAHLGYFRSAFVERRRWLTDAAYADLVALCQFLPGPASSQVGIAIGKLRAGYAGALAAWVAFTLPSVVALLGFGYGITRFDPDAMDGILHGLKLAALAVVANAVWQMTRTLTPDLPRIGVALAAAAVALLLPSSITQIGILAVAGGLGMALPQSWSTPLPAQAHGSRRGAVLWLAVFFVLLAALPLAAALTGNHTLAIAEKFYRTGSLVFGGGHVVLPLLDGELVKPGLIAPDLFLAGYGAAQAVPGPLFSFAAYAGAMLQMPPNGLPGAALALVMIYLPSFLLVLGVLPLWQGLRGNPRLRSGLDMANAAVVGLLLAVLWDPVATTAIRGWTDIVWAVAAVVLLRLRWPPWIVVLLSAAAGYLVGN